MTEFLRMSGIYWGVTALDLMDDVSKLDKASIVEFIKKCQCPISGGFSPCENHDPHILYTLSAVQVIIRKSSPCSRQKKLKFQYIFIQRSFASMIVWVKSIVKL